MASATASGNDLVPAGIPSHRYDEWGAAICSVTDYRGLFSRKFFVRKV
jgi:hypothetical protein